MGFWEDFTIYLWNFIVYWKVLMGVDGCFMVGIWGMFWSDDCGRMMQYCYEMFDGLTVTFPAYFYSQYAADYDQQ